MDPARVGGSGRGDEHQFILGHGILWDGTDKDIAVELIQNVQAQFPEFKLTSSFDRSFYSPPVREELDTMLEITVMSAKGKLSRRVRIPPRTRRPARGIRPWNPA